MYKDLYYLSEDYKNYVVTILEYTLNSYWISVVNRHYGDPYKHRLLVSRIVGEPYHNVSTSTYLQDSFYV